MGGNSKELNIYGGTITGDATKNNCALYVSGDAVARIMGGKISGALYKNGTACKISFLGGKFDTEANTGTATATTSGRFKVSDFLSPYSTIAGNTDDDKDAYPYVVTLADPIVLDDSKAYTNAVAMDDVNVSYTRKIKSNVGTIVLPFVPEANDKVKFYEFSGAEPEGDVVVMREVSDVEPGKAYVFKYEGEVDKENGTELTFSADAATLHANTIESNTNGLWTMTGTYTEVKKNGVEDKFYYVKASNGVVYRAEGTTRFAPYRAWATYSGLAQLKAFRMRLGDTVTGIATIEDDGINVYTGKIYDLSGREVSVPQRGNVYIINGKKIKY